MDTNDVKEKLSGGKDKVNAGIKSLPFRGLVEKKIPEETRTKYPVLNKLIPITNYIVCALVVVIIVVIIANAAGGGTSSARVNFGAYPADYEIAYFNMVSMVLDVPGALTVRDLFGRDAVFATSFQGMPSRVALESASGDRNEFTAILLLSVKNTNSNEYTRGMRLQVKFEADSVTERSYVRYIRLVNLLNGQTNERQSYGSQMQDAELTGFFAGTIEYFWDL